MRLENTFTVPGDPAATWKLLLDVPAIAPCLPGAELTDILGVNAYKGRARVKVGPVLLTFAGTAEIAEADEAERRALVRARGADEKGRGSAQAEVAFALKSENGGTRVDIVTDLNLVGAVAQYGRASGLMQGIAGEITKDFARNLEELIRARGVPSAELAPAAGAARPAGGLGLLLRGILAWLKGLIGALGSRLSRSGQ